MRERSRSFVTEEQRSIRAKGGSEAKVCYHPTGPLVGARFQQLDRNAVGVFDERDGARSAR
jgi:hypothetical protein